MLRGGTASSLRHAIEGLKITNRSSSKSPLQISDGTLLFLLRGHGVRGARPLPSSFSSSSAASSTVSCPSLSIWRRKKEMGKEGFFVVHQLKRLARDAHRLDRFMKSHVSRLLRTDLLAILAEFLRQDHIFLSMKSFEKLHVFGEPSSKLNQSYDISQDELSDYSDQNWVDDPNTELQYLSSIFPSFSVDSLAEMLSVHYGDINATIDMLQQFECDGDEFELPLQTTESSNNLGPESHKASASGGASVFG